MGMTSWMRRFVRKPPMKQTMTDHSKALVIRGRDKQSEGSLSAAFHDPKLQPSYTFFKGAWKENGHAFPTTDLRSNDVKIKLVTWNIDFQAVAGPNEWLLHYNLDLIQATSWVQSRFRITDISSTNWLSRYGTTTLIDLRLPIGSVFRTRYASKMGRDALFVDLDCSDGTRCTRNSRIRLGNTHLESLAADPPLRPAQVALATRLLNDDSVHGGVLAGDFNAIQGFDRTLHVENDLKDAYLEAGGIEGAEKEGGEKGCEKGWTWGMQSHGGQRERFGCSRMDKMLFCGGVRLEQLERIGEGVKVPEGEVGEGIFATDHLGLVADLVIEY
ncbi:hypothetical protein HO133_004375 [Letharia lupina]|uniref:Endonuclease/exonuclease/phosphatase domain-containing protein n=1 Tax=Letharia lupina TaxID=560253 RepID=A0A8H6FKA2_9LECA|nr:uncharacterized protein HO133_004375 [Letharia lupina]KAF6230037.1 hypothetical protein HO133_004375 [Letharia lupina]